MSGSKSLYDRFTGCNGIIKCQKGRSNESHNIPLDMLNRLLTSKLQNIFADE